MAFAFGPVAAVDRQFGQGHADIDGIGILFDQAQILAVSLLQLALPDQRVGIGLARQLVKTVVFEDVAKLDHRAFFFAVCQQGQAGLVIVFGLFLRGFATGQGQHRGDHHRKHQQAGGQDHDRESVTGGRKQGGP